MSYNDAEVLSIFEKQEHELNFTQHSSFARGESEMATRLITSGVLIGATLIMAGFFALVFTLFPGLGTITDFWFQALGVVVLFGGIAGLVYLFYKFVATPMEEKAAEVRYQDGKDLQKLALEQGFKMPLVTNYAQLVRTKFEKVDNGMVFRPVFVGWGGSKNTITIHLQSW